MGERARGGERRRERGERARGGEKQGEIEWGRERGGGEIATGERERERGRERGT